MAKLDRSCERCREVWRLGTQLKEHVCEVRRDIEEITGSDGLVEAMRVFDSLIKLTAPHLASPQAVCINGIWFARLDRSHPLHRYYDDEFARLNNK